MGIAVIGGTGTAGREIVAQLRAEGREVRVVSRAHGVDLHTGAGLDAALAGVSVIIDASNPFPSDPTADLGAVFVEAMGHLLAAARAAGVEHVVYTSIGNIDAPVFAAFPYYAAKWAQEQMIEGSGLSYSIIRSSQWFEFALNPAAVISHQDQVEVQDWLIQPIAMATVVGALIDAVRVRPVRRNLAGPEAMRLPDLTAAVLRSRGDHRPVRRVAAHDPRLEHGMLLPRDDAELLGPDLGEWLAGSTASAQTRPRNEGSDR